MSKRIKQVKPLPQENNNLKVFTIRSEKEADDFVNALLDAVSNTTVQVKDGPKPNPAASYSACDDRSVPAVIEPIEFFDNVDNASPFYTPTPIYKKLENIMTHTDAIAASIPNTTSKYIEDDMYLNINRSNYASGNGYIANDMVESMFDNISQILRNKIRFIITNAMYYGLIVFAEDLVDFMKDKTKYDIRENEKDMGVDDELIDNVWGSSAVNEIYNFMAVGYLTGEELANQSTSASSHYPFFNQVSQIIDSLNELIRNESSVADRDIATRSLFNAADNITMEIERIMSNRIDVLVASTQYYNSSLGCFRNLANHQGVDSYSLAGMMKEVMSTIHLPLINGIIKHGLPQLVVLATDVLRPYIENIDYHIIGKIDRSRYY